MTLTTCPECGSQVSDHAPTCPNCGFPIAQPPQQKTSPSVWKILLAILAIAFALGVVAFIVAMIAIGGAVTETFADTTTTTTTTTQRAATTSTTAAMLNADQILGINRLPIPVAGVELTGFECGISGNSFVVARGRVTNLRTQPHDVAIRVDFQDEAGTMLYPVSGTTVVRDLGAGRAAEMAGLHASVRY